MKNNKGFTLLEVIIAMAILSVVVLVGYKVINGSNKVTESQKNTSKGQLSTNLVNKYVSKDIEILEAKKNVEFENKGMTIESGSNKYTQRYIYTIDTVNHDEGGKIVYKVEYDVTHEGEIKDDEFKGIYSVNRKSNDEDGNVISDVELVNNQKTIYKKNGSISGEEFLINNVKPFDIHKDNVDINIYTVGVHYESNNNEKNYEFDVSPRMSLASIETQPPIEPPVDPEIDPDFDGTSAYIRFKQENGSAWSDAGPKDNSANNYEGRPIGIKDMYKIEAKIAVGGNSGFAEAFLDNKNSSASAQNKDEFPKGNYDQIKVSLYGDVIIENLTIEVIYKSNTSYKPIENENIDKERIIPIDRTRNGHDQNEIIITGDMRLKEGSNYGDIIINLGHSK